MGKHPEKILCVASSQVAAFLPPSSSPTGGSPARFSPDVGVIDPLLDTGEYRVRDDVEEDEAWRQIIPYVVFYDPFQRKVFSYTRAKVGSEARLHANISIGVGGHVDALRPDGPNTAAVSNFPGLRGLEMQAAARREVAEEITFVPRQACSRTLVVYGESHQQAYCGGQIVGLINDASNAVGRVHLGVTIVAIAPTATVQPREDHLADGRYRTGAELVALAPRLESWTHALLYEYLLPSRLLDA